jgi:hypothetical protein
MRNNIIRLIIMILILRGHIRDSFNDTNLLNTLKSIIKIIPNITIYIHTWNVISSSISWREIQENNMKVTSEYILNYFNDIRASIKHIEISEDTSIELIGDTSGNIGTGLMPKIGWKRMWYGKYKILSIIKSEITNTKTIVINTRFDIHTLLFNSLTKETIISYIYNIYRTENSNILFNNNELGCDNLYSGSLENMYKLSYDFHTNLDEIINRLPDSKNQELYVLRNAIYLKFKKVLE